MNPPFGARNSLIPWLQKFVDHGNGVCLVPDRTSAPWWQQFAPRMERILFVDGKLKFIGADGKPGLSPAQGTCLMAIGVLGCEALRRAAANGLGFLARQVHNLINTEQETREEMPLSAPSRALGRVLRRNPRRCGAQCRAGTTRLYPDADR